MKEEVQKLIQQYTMNMANHNLQLVQAEPNSKEHAMFEIAVTIYGCVIYDLEKVYLTL